MRKVVGSSDSKIFVNSDSDISGGAGITFVWQIFMKTFLDDFESLVLTQNPKLIFHLLAYKWCTLNTKE